MSGDRKNPGKGEKDRNVEQLTDDKLDKVSGGKVCLICQPQHDKKPKGIDDDSKVQPLCQPQLEGPEPRPCIPRGY